MWLTEFREAHGLSVEQLGRAVRHRGKQLDPPIFIRDSMLVNLERTPDYKVLPAFANLIAEVCGATAEQRDALTLPKHAGTWRPTGEAAMHIEPRPAPAATARTIRQPAAPIDVNRGRAVVCVDPDGQVRETYRGATHAANRCGISKDMVLRRCLRRMKSNEFAGLGYTFRFRDEWDQMTQQERRADLDRTRWWRGSPSTARVRAGKPKKGHFRRPVVVIDGEGREVGRYSYANDAAKATGVPYSTVVSHCIMTKGFRSHYTRKGLGFFYADMWDDMDEDAREAATLKR